MDVFLLVAPQPFEPCVFQLALFVLLLVVPHPLELFELGGLLHPLRWVVSTVLLL